MLHKFPNTPSLTLAKKILKENPSLFTSVEAARTAIRYFRGAVGKRARKNADPKLARAFDESMFNPFGLPETDEVEYIPFILPKRCKRILYLSDIHIPYHNIGALTCALQFGLDRKVWDLKMSEVSLLKGDSINFRFLGMDMENRTKVNGELALTEVNGQIQLVVNSWLLPKTVRIIGQNKGEEVFSEIINVPESPDANWWPIALGLLALVSAHYESVTVSNSDGSSTTTSSWGVDIGGAAKIQIPNGITFYGDFIKLQFDRNYKAGDEYSIAKVNQVEINGSLLNSIIIEEEKHDS